MKAKMNPVTSPGSDSGNTTFRKVRSSPAPRSLEASRMLRGIFSSAVYTGMNTKGMQM